MSSLGDLLASLHDGPDAVRRLRAEIASSTDAEVASAAWRHLAESSGGGVFYAFASEDEDEDEDATSTEACTRDETRTRIWVDLESRFEREESSGGRRALAVRRGATWWRWDPGTGAISNEHEDEAVGASVADDQKWILGGLRVVGSLRLEPLGHAEVAGRATRRCLAVPRVGSDDDGDRDWNLHELPAYGATEYEIDVDAELGLILRVKGFFNGEEFSVAEVVDLGVNETFAEDLFVFASPDGSAVRGFRDLHGEHHAELTPRRLAELADFALFVPRKVPDGWEFSLGFVDGGTRPPQRPFATMHLRSPDNLRDVRVGQTAIEAEGDYQEWDHANPAPWSETVADGIRFEWRDPAEDWQPARVRFDRAGTRVFLDSPGLSAAELLDLATGMVPLDVESPDFGGAG